jgi:hypothetical protein
MGTAGAVILHRFRFCPDRPFPEEIIMESSLTQIIEMAIALLMAVIAVWQNCQKGQVVAFFDPGNESVTTPPSSVPARTWKMADASNIFDNEKNYP